MPRPVLVVPYDPDWPEHFAAERERLAAAFAEVAAAIHHVGSTSVPGLSAKPVVDVLVEGVTLDALDAAAPRVEAIGYVARGEYGIEGRRYFVGTPEGRPRFHVHAFERGHWRAERHLRLRDFLRAHPADAGRYGALKARLAVEHAGDRAAYQEAKAGFVEELQERAARWATG